jgi:dipeptidyl aminopeptidase/acylaminoacyl peptidase
MTATAPFGTWRSPITSELIVAGSIGLGPLLLKDNRLLWTESRPTEAGRNVLCQAELAANSSEEIKITELNPAPFNVRTRVHEYGGGAFQVTDPSVYAVNYADQRIYRLNAEATPLTPEAAYRYADFILDPTRNRLITIREDHSNPAAPEPKNELVAIDLTTQTQTILATGHDFYASPSLSPDGKLLVWLTWDHPRMPWEGTELWIAALNPDGSLTEPALIAGSPSESIFQPLWCPNGKLYFVSDRTGWWNLYRWHSSNLEDNPTHPGELEAICPKNAEFGQPQWVFGMSSYGLRNAQELITSYSENGVQKLASLNLNSLVLTEIPTPYTSIAGLRVGDRTIAFLGGSATHPTALVTLDLITLELTVIRQATQLSIDPKYLSIPEPIEFPTENGLTAHAFYYPPTNGDFAANSDDRPPLLVKSHGGPTAATEASFNLRVQYWTSRGFGILDVNYGGSTGYGRAYRQRLDGNWGIVDVADCANGAKYLAEQGRVDGDRLVIDGSSAGGYTTLAALAFTNVFKAGASYYGVSDLTVLATDTHKFESRYLDSLIGPYPEQADLYKARSPINAIDRLSCPIIFFQGDEDKIVPPNQAELMVNALKEKGLPVAYLLFEGEQHGFRKAENIRRAIDGEFYFYSRVFGFKPAEELPVVTIANLD